MDSGQSVIQICRLKKKNLFKIGDAPYVPWLQTLPLFRILELSLAYFIYDLVCCWLDNNIGIDNLAHHLVSIVGIGAGLAYEMCGSEIVATLLITEISSPFLHLRELLKELGYKNTLLNLAADVSFAVIFTLARMCVGPYLCYVTMSAKNPILIKQTGQRKARHSRRMLSPETWFLQHFQTEALDQKSEVLFPR
ncbi:putative TRAM/LAG1/CLN8 domain-containing protein [Helianthus annuus]|uniref:Putative TRAM/LAG1/CLN8-like domain-containing protein n=1 Tax=Helianthus annuus TaxID=4232 RepID=A0A251TZD2_HELAN|nr:putative TRAM/LAG1/CLN8 domain-containing protein [Helianthus annuus]